MDLFDLINWLWMAYNLGLLESPDDGGRFEVVFVGDAIPGSNNAH
jgi:hypothetical protein